MAAADNITTTAATQPSQPLHHSEQLMYSTVRLHHTENGRTSWGTGFFYRFFSTNQTMMPAIVTNRHVVDGWKTCSFSLASRKSDGTPDPTAHVDVVIQNFSTVWIPHPSADLAIIPIAPTIDQLEKDSKPVFCVHLDQTLIPTKAEFDDLTAIEQVLTVGFPGQVWDDVHNLPVFHRGYTATAPYIDFKGKPEFLIDFSTWPGSSGSMVLLYNDQGWIDRRGNSMLGGTRIKLIGVVYGVATQDVSGNVVIQNGPIALAAQGQMAVPTNLGACIRTSRILEFEPLLISKGVVPPPGYQVRSN